MQIFRAGTHTDASGQRVTISAEDLAKTVSAYQVSLHEAPIVVGHPKHDDPAYGWVAGLKLEGEALHAQPQQLDSQFSEMVNAGRFKKISASFYAPTSPINPAPGTYYLKHVGFLGAMPPAVKGLKPVAFAEGEAGVITFEFSEDPTSDDERGSGRNLDDRERELAEREARLDRAEFASFAQGLLDQGKQFSKALAVEVFMTLSSDLSLEFAEGGQTQQLSGKEAFKLFLSKLPKVVEFKEVAGGDLPEASTDPQAIAARIEAYRTKESAKGNLVSFAEAMGYIQRHPEFAS